MTKYDFLVLEFFVIERVEDIAACLSVGDHEWDEVAIKSKVQQRLAAYEMPRHWWLCQDLKPDARGKLSRRAWRKKFLTSQRSG